MLIDNTVFLTGRIAGQLFFNRVPAGDRDTLSLIQFPFEAPQ